MKYIVALSLLYLLGCSDGGSTVAAENELSDIEPLWEVLVEISKSSDIEGGAEEKVEALIVEKIVVVRSLEPDVYRLSAPALEGLCAAILYVESPYFSIRGTDKEVFDLVTNYLSSIKPNLESKIKDLNKTIWTSERCPI